MNHRFLAVFLPSVLVMGGLDAPILAHPGRLNGSGCHNNRRTGDYHCHSGGSSSGSGSYNRLAPAPICRDVTRETVNITLVMSDNRRKSEYNVSIKSGSARLDGNSGTLYSYIVQGLPVRNFINDSKTINKYSFNQSQWIPVESIRENGETTIYTLESNGTGVAQEEYTTVERTERICN